MGEKHHKPLYDRDLNEVREYYSTLRELIILHPGGWDDAESRARAGRLCRAGMAAVDDSECQERLAKVEAQAAELYSRDGHHKWKRRSMSGADYLRLQILIALEALNARLALLDALRGRERASRQQPGEDVAPMLENEEVPAPGK
jgi:hypothetical protein